MFRKHANIALIQFSRQENTFNHNNKMTLTNLIGRLKEVLKRLQDQNIAWHVADITIFAGKRKYIRQVINKTAT